MRTVYKYPAPSPLQHKFTLLMPGLAVVMSAAFQGDVLVLWAKVNTDNPATLRTFWLAGTGHRLPEIDLEFVDTAFIGDLVFHVFEEV